MKMIDKFYRKKTSLKLIDIPLYVSYYFSNLLKANL